MRALIENKIKAIFAAVTAAVASYWLTAATTGNVVTLHGVEVAAVTAVLTFFGTHEAPANKPLPTKRRRSTKPAR